MSAIRSSPTAASLPAMPSSTAPSLCATAASSRSRRGRTACAAAIDLEGDYLVPGLVELHTDNLEKHFAPRPGVQWPSLAAVMAHDAQIAAAGITTVFDSLSLGDVRGDTDRVQEPRAAWSRRSARRASAGLSRAEHACTCAARSRPTMPCEAVDRWIDLPLVGLISLNGPHAGPAPVPRSGEAQAVLHAASTA